MNAKRLASFLLFFIAFSLAGCISTQEPSPFAAGGSREPILVFPDAKSIVGTSNILHEVKLAFEMDRPPREEEQPVFGWLLNLPGEEEYVAGYQDNPSIQEALRPGGRTGANLVKEAEGTHRFSFERGMFIVGGLRYPAESGAELFIFQERPGPFTFTFHGRRITVERNSPWKPAVLYRLLREEEELPAEPRTVRGRQRLQARRTVTRILGEEVQVGPHRIVAAPEGGLWKVNGFQVEAKPGGSISIDRRGEVQSSS